MAACNIGKFVDLRRAWAREQTSHAPYLLVYERLSGFAPPCLGYCCCWAAWMICLFSPHREYMREKEGKEGEQKSIYKTVISSLWNDLYTSQYFFLSFLVACQWNFHLDAWSFHVTVWEMSCNMRREAMLWSLAQRHRVIMQRYAIPGQDLMRFWGWSINHALQFRLLRAQPHRHFSLFLSIDHQIAALCSRDNSEEEGWQSISWLGTSLRSLKPCQFFKCMDVQIDLSLLLISLRDSSSSRDGVMLLQARRLLGPKAECYSRADPTVPARFNHPSPRPNPFDLWDFWKAWWNADSGEEEKGGRGWSGKVLGKGLPRQLYVYMYILYVGTAGAMCCVGEHDWTTGSCGSLCLGDVARLCIRLSMYVKCMFVQLPPRRLIIYWISPLPWYRVGFLQS